MSTLSELFTAPGAEYRGKPFWSWNGELRADELARQVGIMKEMGLGGYFMHSRAGLITEYLGEEWFDLINKTADAGEACGLEAWLYDEDRWPSGSAGGKVTVDPQYRMKSLYVFESAPEKFQGVTEDTLALFVAKIDGINAYAYKRVPEGAEPQSVIDEQSESAKEAPGAWKVLHFRIIPDKPNSNYNGTTYIDTMSRKAVDRYLELTHEEYQRHCGNRLGRNIKGIFTDEPHRGLMMDNRKEEEGVISCGAAWTDDLPQEFQKRYDYDLLAILPELFYRPDGQMVRPVKLHYIDLADNLFLERFAKPIYDWCNAHGIIYTGHVLHEDSLMNQTVPEGSLMRFYEYEGIPGIDCLTEGNDCYWIAKQVASAARQLGKKWMLSELYGCTGWQFNLKGHKAVGDWQALFGINLRCQHLSWYTMEGESKRDYPASILHQTPWYKDYRVVEDYFARFGVMMQQGRPACDVLVLNPIESLWCQAYLGWSNWIFSTSPYIVPYEERYKQTFHFLADNQIDFDYGEEQMMASRWKLEKDAQGTPVLRIGEAVYRVILVTNMLTIRPSTLEMLQAFCNAGGTVIFAGDLPAYVDALPSNAPATLAQQCIQVPFAETDLVQAIRQSSREYLRVARIADNGATETAVFAQMRKEAEGGRTIAVILNTDRKNGKDALELQIRTQKPQSVELWDFATGARYNADSIAEYRDGMMCIRTALLPAETQCFVLADTHEAALPAYTLYQAPKQTFALPQDTQFEYTLDEENVCVLDYCRWRWKDQEWHPAAEALKADQQVRDSRGLEHRGGEMLQPWFAKLHDKEIYGDLELEYEFFIDELPAGPVFLAGERPEWNDYRINGTPVSQYANIRDFWIDDCFKKMPIPAGVLKPGRNTVEIRVKFMRTTNIEALYLVGDFGVKIDQINRRTLVPLPKTLGFGDLGQYALPFYTGNVTYKITPEMYEGIHADGKRLLLHPVAPYAGCFRIGNAILAWDPYEADVTTLVQQKATIPLTVVGNRRNVFGPLHLNPAIDVAYGPGHWVTTDDKWTDAYNRIESGLHQCLMLDA